MHMNVAILAILNYFPLLLPPVYSKRFTKSTQWTGHKDEADSSMSVDNKNCEITATTIHTSKREALHTTP